MKTALKKRQLVMKTLSEGGTKAEAMRAVKAKFGSGIASRDVGLAAKELAKFGKGELRHAVPSSPRNGRLHEPEEALAKAPPLELSDDELLNTPGLMDLVRQATATGMTMVKFRPPYARHAVERTIPASMLKVPITSMPLPTPAQSKAKETSMRRFVLDRTFDATGTSGTGIVAEGVQFSSGHVVIHWLSQLEAINVYGNAMVLEQLHGHNGSTTIKWLDP